MTRRAIGVSERPPLLQTIPLSLQHLFAMFGATVLVPVLFHINPATVLLFNGIGTLLYLFICKGKIPAYLGSSFAFISPVLLLLPLGYEVALGGFIMCGVLFCLVFFYREESGDRLAGRAVSTCGNGRNRCRHRSGAGGRSCRYGGFTPG
ncbi:uracil transporter [Escherichia coli]|nr:uracil transporter [Escherichia coli]